MELAVVLVHYHTPGLLRGAIAALERDAAASDITLEGVVVDNGSAPDDRPLAPAPWRCLEPGENLGYAGGVNLGMAETTAPWAVVMNPDVEVLSGCLAALANALDQGAAVAGPRFFWDRGRRFLLPPTERVGRWAELTRTLAEGSEGWARRARHAWRRHARTQWLASEPIPSHDSSGALLALRRDAWQRIGPFDAGYPLYFEETDWLQRARRAGAQGLFVPAAEAIHLYAQSTVKEGQAAQWFEQSSRRFRQRTYGKRFTGLLEWLGPRVSRPWTPAVSTGPENPAQPGDWLEVSPSPKGYPAAGCRLEPGESPRLPDEIIERLAPGRYFCRRVDRSGREGPLSSLEVL